MDKEFLTQVDSMSYDHSLNVTGESKGEAKMTKVLSLSEWKAIPSFAEISKSRVRLPDLHPNSVTYFC